MLGTIGLSGTLAQDDGVVAAAVMPSPLSTAIIQKSSRKSSAVTSSLTMRVSPVAAINVGDNIGGSGHYGRRSGGSVDMGGSSGSTVTMGDDSDG